MKPVLLVLFLAGGVASDLPWSQLALTIEEDSATSSDQATLCRVRVVNHGPHTWPGRDLHFEARALDGGIVVEVARGRFGLSLPPYGTLETLIGFSGPYRRFEVVPAEASSAGRGGKSSGKSARGKGAKPKPRRGRPPRRS